MDPEETLAELRLLVAKDQTPGETLDPHEVERLTTLFHSLDEWLCHGGFIPRDWDL